MLKLNDITSALHVRSLIDYCVTLPDEQSLIDLSKDDLILESCALEEIEATYFYDLAHPKELMIEAITSKMNRIDRTLKAFNKQLSAKLSGTGIESLEYKVGTPKKTAGFAVLAASIPLSDGQSISIIFHAPDDDTSKILEHDTLIAFRFMLNKRDVTHAVAPSGGHEVSLKQVTMALSNLAERNSEKFLAKKSETKVQNDKLKNLQESTSKIEEEKESLASELTNLELKLDTEQSRAHNLLKMAKNTEQRNKILEAQLKELNDNKRQLERPSSTVEDEEDNPQSSFGKDAIKGDKYKSSLKGAALSKVIRQDISQATKKESNPLFGIKATVRLGKSTHKDKVTLTIKKMTNKSSVLDVRTTLLNIANQYNKKSGSSFDDSTDMHFIVELIDESEVGIAFNKALNQTKRKSTPKLTNDLEDQITAIHKEAEIIGGANHWYGLKARPFSLGVAPNGKTALMNTEQAKYHFNINEASNDVRHGAIAYKDKLSEEDISRFELVDLSKNEETSDKNLTPQQKVITPGGYAKVSGNNHLEDKFQDALDSHFSARIFDVLQTLKGKGWELKGSKMEAQKNDFALVPQLKQVGAGANVVGITYELANIKTNMTLDEFSLKDDLSMTSDEIAQEIDSATPDAEELTVPNENIDISDTLSFDALKSAIETESDPDKLIELVEKAYIDIEQADQMDEYEPLLEQASERITELLESV